MLGRHSFRVGQVSDVHLDLGQDVRNSGVDSRSSFLRILEDVRKFKLDLLVFSGDLTEHGSQAEYNAFFEIVKEYSGEWCVILGNHDNTKEFEKSAPFPVTLKNGNYYFRRDVNGHPFFFLDSSCGTVSRDQLEWLVSEAKNANEEVFLFMHHPPCLCGHRFMDSLYALKNLKEVGEFLDRIPKLKSIFVGHYHSGMTIYRGRGQTVYVTPATQMQLDPDSPEFRILSTVPGWRLIEYDGEKLSTELRFTE